MNNTYSIPILASFATIKSLADDKVYQNPYQLLSEFIIYVIHTEKLHAFTASDMKAKLTNHFEFHLPEAVVKTTAKKMTGITSENGIFSVSFDSLGSDSLFKEKKNEADESSADVIQAITEYIKSRTDGKSIHDEELTQDIVNFLIDDKPFSSGKYTDLIGEFILKNEKDPKTHDSLEKIREGSILFIGLAHNINETGSITKPLSLYLSTEILFSLAGYNGEIYKEYADDFINQIKAANINGSAKISLFYFDETKKEIDAFFATAEGIVDGKINHAFKKPAMVSITNGCSTSAEVTVKQSDFYHNLQYVFGIKEDPYSGTYYDLSTYEYNMESADEIENEDRKRELGLRFVSHINKNRNGKIFYNELDSEALFVTNTGAFLQISREQSEKLKDEHSLDSVCNYAVSLDRITSMLWYKLGKGFSKSDFPINVSAALKARTVLSSSIAKKADHTYTELKKQYASGELTNDQVAARIIMLRNKPLLPEDLEGDTIAETLDFSPEFLSKYEEQNKANKKALEDSKEELRTIRIENEKYIETINEENNRVLSEKDATISSQSDKLQSKEAENARLRAELNEYHQREAAIAEKKRKRKNHLNALWKIAVFLIAAVAIVGLYIHFDNIAAKVFGALAALADIVWAFVFVRKIIIDGKK